MNVLVVNLEKLLELLFVLVCILGAASLGRRDAIRLH
jgi:hypothetical protein